MKKDKIGIIVGRFQVDQLTQGHTFLIDTVLDECRYCIIILGESPTRVTTRHPLPYEAREAMILKEYPVAQYPTLFIGKVNDCKEDSVWCSKLDEEVDRIAPNWDDNTLREIIYYGSRDSFINMYCGKYSKKVIEPRDGLISATNRRAEIQENPSIGEQAFREGLIYAAVHKYPTVYPTVDIFVYTKHDMCMLLGRKTNESQWRLIGGFVDKTDACLEDAALREMNEEAPAIITKPMKYLLSQPVEDWRYRGTRDSIMTTLFLAEHITGSEEAGDDLEELQWFSMDDIFQGFLTQIVEDHRPLIEKAVQFIKQQK
jgi:bifunctional NMN adenylyltransferase/nudix hydrolase